MDFYHRQHIDNIRGSQKKETTKRADLFIQDAEIIQDYVNAQNPFDIKGILTNYTVSGGVAGGIIKTPYPGFLLNNYELVGNQNFEKFVDCLVLVKGHELASPSASNTKQFKVIDIEIAPSDANHQSNNEIVEETPQPSINNKKRWLITATVIVGLLIVAYLIFK